MSELHPEMPAPERPAPIVPVHPTASPIDEIVQVAPNLPVVATGLAPGVAPAPVQAQRSSHVNASKLESEKVVVAAPMSFAGSAARIWKLTGMTEQPAARVALALAAISLIACAWTVVLAWYV